MACPSLMLSEREVIDEILKCPVCFEKYDDGRRTAKFLPCLHGFCLECLERHVDNQTMFTCPLCRRDTEVPPGGVCDYPDNFIANKLKRLERFLAIDRAESQALRCESCRDEGEAVAFCSDKACEAYLCEKCTSLHGHLRIYEGHIVTPMNQLGQQAHPPLPRPKLPCKRHKDQRLTLLCDEEQCQSIICLLCLATAHKNHRTIDLDEKCSLVKDELQCLAEKVGRKTDSVNEISGKLHTCINRANDIFKTKSTEVARIFDDLKDMLQARQEEVIDNMREICEEKTKSLRSQTNDAESLSSQIDSARQFADRACEIANPVELLNTREQIISRLRELNALDVNVALPCQTRDEADLSFAVEHRQVLSDFKRRLASLGKLKAGAVPRFTVEFPSRVGASFLTKATHTVRLLAGDESCPSLESFKGQVLAILTLPDGDTSECKNVKYCHDAFEVEFQPLVAGGHQLSVSVSGIPVTGSPFEILATDTEPSKRLGDIDEQAISCDLTWTEACVGCQHAVLVKIHGEHDPDSISARYEMPDCQHTESGVGDITKVATEGDVAANVATYRVLYTPPAAGKLIMTILLADKPAPSSPFVINVESLHPQSTQIINPSMGKYPPGTAVVGMPYSVFLVTRDLKKQRVKRGGFPITATIQSGSPSTIQRHGVTDNQDGSYTLSFTPDCLEQHFISIEICGYPIRHNTSLVISVRENLCFVEPPGGYIDPSDMAVDVVRDVVYIADARNDVIQRLTSDGCSVSADPRNVETHKSLLIVVDSSGRLVALAPDLKSVWIYDSEGKIECRWRLAAGNDNVTNLAITKHDLVIVGNSWPNALFIYQQNGRFQGTVNMLPGALAKGMQNVCSDRDDNILVATHKPPLQLIRYSFAGKQISSTKSPVETNQNQLAVASTPDGALILAVVGNIYVLNGTGNEVLQQFKTSDIYTTVAAFNDDCFMAFDPGEKRVVKYVYDKPK